MGETKLLQSLSSVLFVQVVLSVMQATPCGDHMIFYMASKFDRRQFNKQILRGSKHDTINTSVIEVDSVPSRVCLSVKLLEKYEHISIKF